MALKNITPEELAQAIEEEAKKIHAIYLEVNSTLRVDNCICSMEAEVDVYKIDGNTHAINCSLTQISYETLRTKIYPEKVEE